MLMRLQKIILPVLVAAITIASCTTKKEVLSEPVKDLNALWRIETVTRNTADITPYIDSASFRLMLAPDNTYTLQGNNIPFVVNAAAGTWSVDDPQYPYNISFKPTDSTRSFSASITTPTTKGNRILSIKFSPGCPSNAYVYTFEKADQ